MREKFWTPSKMFSHLLLVCFCLFCYFNFYTEEMIPVTGERAYEDQRKKDGRGLFNAEETSRKFVFHYYSC